MKVQHQVLRVLALAMLVVALATSSVLPSGLALAQQDEQTAVVQAALTALQAQSPLAEGLHYVTQVVAVDGDWGVARFLVYRTSDNTPVTSNPTDSVLAYREGETWQAATVTDRRYPDWLVAVPTTLVSQEEKDRLLEALGVTPDPTATPLPADTPTPVPTAMPLPTEAPVLIDKGSAAGGGGGLPFLSIGNEYIEVAVSEQGRFTIGTTGGDPSTTSDNDKPLLFGHSSNIGSSFSSLRIINNDTTNDYRLGNPPDWAPGLPPVAPPISDGTTITTIWEQDGVRVEERLWIAYSSATERWDTTAIEYTIKNNNQTSRDVGLRIMLDVMVGGNDGAPIFVTGTGCVTDESEWYEPNVRDDWIAYESLTCASGGLEGLGQLAGDSAIPPGRFVVAPWPKAHNTKWDYTIKGPEPVDKDSATILYYNPVTLDSFGEIKYLTYYGLNKGPNGACTVEAGDWKISKGSSDTSEVWVHDISNLYGIEFNLGFVPSIVQVGEDADPVTPGMQIAVGSLFAGKDHFVARNWVENPNGVIQFSISLREPALPINGSGAVASITWEGIGEGMSDLILEDVKLSDRDGFRIDCDIKNGTVKVEDGHTTDPISGVVKLQSRYVYSGTEVFLTEEPCPPVVIGGSSAGIPIPIPGAPFTVTEASGDFEIIPYPGGSYQCLQAVRHGYLVGQKSMPQGYVGEITLLGGDATEDDVINIFDLALIAGRYGTDDPTADINGDGKVDIFDLSVAAGNYGQKGPQTDWQ